MNSIGHSGPAFPRSSLFGCSDGNRIAEQDIRQTIIGQPLQRPAAIFPLALQACDMVKSMAAAFSAGSWRRHSMLALGSAAWGQASPCQNDKHRQITFLHSGRARQASSNHLRDGKAISTSPPISRASCETPAKEDVSE